MKNFILKLRANFQSVNLKKNGEKNKFNFFGEIVIVTFQHPIAVTDSKSDSSIVMESFKSIFGSVFD